LFTKAGFSIFLLAKFTPQCVHFSSYPSLEETNKQTGNIIRWRSFRIIYSRELYRRASKGEPLMLYTFRQTG